VDLGVEEGYENVDHQWVAAPASTVKAIRSLVADAPPARARVVDAGSLAPGPVRTEDGGSLSAGEPVPAGYHTLLDGDRESLIAVPPRCPLPARGWGLVVQLYSLLSAGSAGIGDLEDLRQLGGWVRSAGGDVVLTNPLHATLPGEPQQASPYYPSSRLFLNPLYLRVPEVSVAVGDRIDRDAVWRAKLPALEREFTAFSGGPDFDAFLAERGPLLYGFAAFCARYEGLEGDQDRVRFHAWLQWRLDQQLAAAAAEVGLVQDIAVGVDPAGADAWLWRDVVVEGARVGAPPDTFNPEGQDWGIPPFDPWRLRAAGYEPFIQVLRAAFRHGAGVRIDHVMGLFRLYWIPTGADPRMGTYVRYPWRDLLGIVALEAWRAGAFVVGEDLGTVEPWVRDELVARDVLSYRLLWFENEVPSAWPERALAAVTTHDLPTVAGMVAATGAHGGSVADAVRDGYAQLAASPCRLVAATLEDILEVVEQPNRPGTLDPWNWSRPLPRRLEELVEDPRLAEVATILNARVE
jgi:4-alpha-glucanotransferase